MPTTEELNAGFDAVLPDLHELTNEFVPEMFGYRAKVNAAINSDARVRALIVDGVRRVIEAVDHVRAGKTPPAPEAKIVAGLKALA